MDDLLGLDWKNPQDPPKTTTPSFPNLRPSQTPSLSGRSTPNIIRPSSTANSQPSLKIGSKPLAPANDSFASLLSNKPPKPTNALSLQERQRQLLEEKAKKEAAERERLQAQFGTQHDAFWNGLGGTQNGQKFSPPPVGRQAQTASKNEDDDLLASFSASAPVDASSHFPPQSTRSMPPGHAIATTKSTSLDFAEDDDPFGLSQLPTKSAAPQPQNVSSNDDDILGMLGRPVEEVASLSKPDESVSDQDSEPTDPQDKAVAELVDMGFPPDKAAIALAATDSGKDVQAAVGILLNQAHEESKRKTQSRNDTPEPVQSQSSRPKSDREPSRRKPADDSIPTWMRPQEDSSRSSSRNRDQAGKEKDVTQIASEIGSTIFKSANSLWKTSQKKVQRAMADLQQEGDSNQPKWMRDAQAAELASSAKPPTQRDMTNEAILLESGGVRPQPPNRLLAHRESATQAAPRNASRIDGRNTPSPAPSSSSRDANRLTRQDLEASNAEVYISPARRRKPQVSPEEPSLLDPISRAPPTRAKSPLASPPVQSNNPFARVGSKPQPKSSPPTPRPKAPPRQIPPASSSALSTSASHRQTGTEAFKRGDYPNAHTAYTSALQPLPANHPVTIVILCNRALANIKVGDPKAAAADAESALAVIGVSKGEGEKIYLGAGEGEKHMKEFYGKALMRKAEALEHMERWTDASKAWKEAVEAGVGGSVAIQSRNRCEKASGGGVSSAQPTRPAMRPKPKSAPPRPKASALDDLSGKRPTVNHAASAEAVRKLREANAAAEKADDEKFALTDHVDAKLVTWKGTKADNLRALLGSLDKVLWDGAGWTKVGMSDLVMPNRVKIIYMKAIAKVHPDKIPQDATTEQRMISAAVFSTLNEAWDKFKTDNNL